jgi:hypothetical protein
MTTPRDVLNAAEDYSHAAAVYIKASKKKQDLSDQLRLASNYEEETYLHMTDARSALLRVASEL